MIINLPLTVFFSQIFSPVLLGLSEYTKTTSLANDSHKVPLSVSSKIKGHCSTNDNVSKHFLDHIICTCLLRFGIQLTAV